MRATARQFRVSVSTVSFWVERVQGMRLDRADFEDGKPGFAWNRTSAALERRILALRSGASPGFPDRWVNPVSPFHTQPG